MMMTVRSAMTKLTSSSSNTNNNTKRMMMWCLSSRPSLVLQRRRFKLETTHLDDDIDDPGITSVVLEQYAYAGTIGGHPLTASGHGISGDLGKNAAVTTVRQLIVDMSGRWFRVDLILATN